MWALAGQNVIGTSHEKSGLPCQDYWAFKKTEKNGGRVLVALADGAGFAKHADSAAHIAVEHALDLMAAYEGDLKEISETEISNWLSSVRQRLESEALKSQVSLSDYSCTLLGALIEGRNGHFWQLGDGGWVVETVRGIEVATWPSSGEFINQTTFVTSGNYLDNWTHAFMADINAAMGFSDGLEHMALDYSAQTARESFVSKIFGAVNPSSRPVEIESQIASLLSSVLINERTDDDKTLVLAWHATVETNVHG